MGDECSTFGSPMLGCGWWVPCDGWAVGGSRCPRGAGTAGHPASRCCGDKGPVQAAACAALLSVTRGWHRAARTAGTAPSPPPCPPLVTTKGFILPGPSPAPAQPWRILPALVPGVNVTSASREETVASFCCCGNCRQSIPGEIWPRALLGQMERTDAALSCGRELPGTTQD